MMFFSLVNVSPFFVYFKENTSFSLKQNCRAPSPEAVRVFPAAGQLHAFAFTNFLRLGFPLKNHQETVKYSNQVLNKLQHEINSA